MTIERLNKELNINSLSNSVFNGFVSAPMGNPQSEHPSTDSFQGSTSNQFNQLIDLAEKSLKCGKLVDKNVYEQIKKIDAATANKLLGRMRTLLLRLINDAMETERVLWESDERAQSLLQGFLFNRDKRYEENIAKYQKLQEQIVSLGESLDPYQFTQTLQETNKELHSEAVREIKEDEWRSSLIAEGIQSTGRDGVAGLLAMLGRPDLAASHIIMFDIASNTSHRLQEEFNDSYQVAEGEIRNDSVFVMAGDALAGNGRVSNKRIVSLIEQSANDVWNIGSSFLTGKLFKFFGGRFSGLAPWRQAANAMGAATLVMGGANIAKESILIFMNPNLSREERWRLLRKQVAAEGVGAVFAYLTAGMARHLSIRIPEETVFGVASQVTTNLLGGISEVHLLSLVTEGKFAELDAVILKAVQEGTIGSVMDYGLVTQGAESRSVISKPEETTIPQEEDVQAPQTISNLESDLERAPVEPITEPKSKRPGDHSPDTGRLEGGIPKPISDINFEGVDFTGNPENLNDLNQRLKTNYSREPLNLRGANFSGLDLTNWDLRRADLEGANFEGASLFGAILNNTNLNGANFSNANLEQASLDNTNLEEVSLVGANLKFTSLKNAKLPKDPSWVQGLKGKSLKSIFLENADMTLIDLRGVDLSYAVISGDINLTEADLRKANLNGIRLKVHKPDLFRTVKNKDLTGVDLSYVTLTGFDLSGVILNSANLNNSFLTNTDLSGADLGHSRFEFASLNNVNLSGADLSDSRIDGADLANANFEGADLSRTYLNRTHLTNINFIKANLMYSHFDGASLKEVNLEGANLCCATVEGATFNTVNLVGAKIQLVPYTPEFTVSYPLSESFNSLMNSVFAKLPNDRFFTKIDHYGQELLEKIFSDSLAVNLQSTLQYMDSWMKTNLISRNDLFRWNCFLKCLNIQEFKQFEQPLSRVENLAVLDPSEKPVGIEITDQDGNLGVQAMPFQHLPETTQYILDILLDPEHLRKQLMNPRSELSSLIPELLNYAPENAIPKLEREGFSNIEPSGPFQHSYHKYQNLLQHTLKVIQSVQESQFYINATEEEQIILTLAALSHDLGKPTQMQRGHNIVDDAHGDLSVRLAYQIGDRLNLPYSMNREIAALVSLKEELTKLTEAHEFKLPDESKLHEYAVSVGSERFLDMIWTLGESDSFRVKDDRAYWDRYSKNRKELEAKLRPWIRHYENLNYPIAGDVDALLRHPGQRSLFFEGKHIQTIDLRGWNGKGYFTNLHVTSELNSGDDVFMRNLVEASSLLSFSYNELPYIVRLYGTGTNALIFRTTPVTSNPMNFGSGHRKVLRGLAENEEIQSSILNMAFHKFEIIQQRFLKHTIDSNLLVDYFNAGKSSPDLDEEGLRIVEQIEEINRLLNYYQKHSSFPKELDKGLEENIKEAVHLFSELIVRFENTDQMINAGYITPKEGYPDNNNEIKGFRNELVGVLIRIIRGLADEEIATQFSKELNFAIKHNIPVVLVTDE